MKNIRYKIAAALALFIGAMSAIVGSRALLGLYVPDYPILQWMLVYNVTAGVVSIVVSILIWQKHRLMKGASILIAASHTFILLLLITVFSEVAAFECIKAMVFRIVIWIVIIILSFKKNKR